MKEQKEKPENWRSQRNIKWIETYCVYPEGGKVGQKARLTDIQKSWLEMIYDSPTRQFILSMPRKNGKTALAAFLLLLHIAGPEAVQNSQLYSAAQDATQAAVVFDLACKAANGPLAGYISIKTGTKEIIGKSKNTRFKSLSSEAATKHGLSPIFVIHDELGQVKASTQELYTVLETGMSAHERPLSIVISTQAASDDHLLSRLIDDAASGDDATNKVALYTSDNEDIFSEEALAEANPHWDSFINKQDLLRTAKAAQRMPADENSYRNLHLNQRISKTAAFVSPQIWCANGTKPDAWQGQKVYVGLDLSISKDLTSIALITENYDVHTFNFLPSENIEQRSLTDGIDWQLQSKINDSMILTPGRTVDMQIVANKIIEIFENAYVQRFAYDSAYFITLENELKRNPKFKDEYLNKFESFRQGFLSMSPAIRKLEELLLNEELKHGNEAVLTYCAQNVHIKIDDTENRKFVKKNKDSTKKIDTMIALVQAAGVLELKEEEKPTITSQSYYF